MSRVWSRGEIGDRQRGKSAYSHQANVPAAPATPVTATIAKLIAVISPPAVPGDLRVQRRDRPGEARAAAGGADHLREDEHQHREAERRQVAAAHAGEQRQRQHDEQGEAGAAPHVHAVPAGRGLAGPARQAERRADDEPERA